MATFKISESFSFTEEDFTYRKGLIKKGKKSIECEYISSFFPNAKLFWQQAPAIKSKKGCYIYTWGTKPIYIGKTCGKKGFSQECFHEEKLKKITDFIKGANCASYKQRKQYLHIYFVYLEKKKECKSLGEYIDEMETRLILKCVDEFGKNQLINSKKIYYKWSIKGFMGNASHRSLKGFSQEYKTKVECFKKLFHKKNNKQII